MADDRSKDDEKGPGLGDRQQDFIKTFFKRGAEFAEELLRENERLRFRVAELESRITSTAPVGGPSGEALRELVTKIEALEKDRQNLLHRYSSAEEENGDWKRRYGEVERENSNLANLYVASYQLHSTLDMREVLQIIREILLNLVGGKTFALYLIHDEDQSLHAITAEGIDVERVPAERFGEGLIGLVAKSGKAYLEGNVCPVEVDLSRPAVVTPLRIKNEIVGVIAIWEFLAQKTGLVDVDFELFNLLTAHAAGAIQAARRNEEAGGRIIKLAEVRQALSTGGF